ncbi:NDP-sugar epimerase, includes UDP-GlcNAc-inverting 4,6-dehydratase FlaA1 and capsular polysaccharide biosynthesis protein EpsC [Desulfonispora thiosulfatigenes DSM 11270]|uniref:NDP-sugar epimerase, includes UDP-GlcNAc-inverting 4,6-dehydratase FlaA1 and capsular polysaccharide biosynthesis protein EpsC n=1 Tax=Desulfonispora thiosulfatigenes DSM 11270 TaxID=656914 RepID=A0A1W1V5F9_DESTI|nr:nucleoside-diphosphate sugar epimerase/dehydratase [Desulfonispora thiosulfatigenes]SMB88525.1 NDP-sugar epimerase, includes UDP-GlcNAc-inverting 4,6-dehydratase FlaA1 and capsular polysaccharide biosynthesis protein EpsC [Desulfonispora thiosulfatigenes DSM 11270]
MSKPIRIFLLTIIDAFLIYVAFYMALLVRFDFDIPATNLTGFHSIAIHLVVVAVICFHLFGLYKRVWQYASIGELLIVVVAVGVATTMQVTLAYFFMEGASFPLPRSIFILSCFFTIFLVGGSRLAWRLFRDQALNMHTIRGGKPILIIGAGDAGFMVAKEMKNHFSGKVNVVGFIDDSATKQSSKILNIPVLGNRGDIPEIVSRYNIERVIIAIPSVEGKVIKEIVEICNQTNAEIQILPGMYDLIEGNVTVNNIREVQVEDLLGRDPIKVDLQGISEYINDRVVLVTGAGGSIGSELCRQIARFSPSELLLLDISENTIYEIELELRSTHPDLKIYPLIKDIREKDSMERVFRQFKPKVVFHAAAHKHVPLMEHNPEEAIKNNVRGTYNVARSADKFGAERFVLISTDKAVNPTSVMGASKRVAEMIIQFMDKTSKTNFMAVRFGNVLGSKGSVVPLFKKQIREGGPVTVTHEEMVRFFMTIPEAVQLVIEAGSMSKGGEIFILDMGEPVKIIDLARTLIRLSGFEPEVDIDIEISGIRPGEKLYEELLISKEGCDATKHKRIYAEKPNFLDIPLIEEVIASILTDKLPNSKEETEKFLKAIIPQFRDKCASNNHLEIENASFITSQAEQFVAG